MNTLDDLDRELDRLWRQHFGQPLPMRGCPSLARRVLNGERAAAAKPPRRPNPSGHGAMLSGA